MTCKSSIDFDKLIPCGWLDSIEELGWKQPGPVIILTSAQKDLNIREILSKIIGIPNSLTTEFDEEVPGFYTVYNSSMNVFYVVNLGNKKSDFPAQAYKLGVEFAKELRKDPHRTKKNFSLNFANASKLPCTVVACFIARLLFAFPDYSVFKSTNYANKQNKFLPVSIFFHQKYPKKEQRCYDSIFIYAKYSIMAASLINAPTNYLNTDTYSAYIAEYARRFKGVTVEVFAKRALQTMGCGALLSVAAGSSKEARLLHLRYKNGSPKDAYAFVGKGIMMDTGGYSLKPSSSMYTMKYDMTGSAIALCSFFSAVALGTPNIELHCVVALAENSIGPNATFPGDVVTAANCKTIEVTNTDAEGRLVLADALYYLNNRMNGRNNYIIDLATLTGACKIALGDEVAALFSNDDQFAADIIKCSDLVGERVWRLPLYSGYKKHLTSSIADLKNADMKAGGSAGTITAALFLQEFVPAGFKWAHLDIAGVSWDNTSNLATAWGVMLLNTVLTLKI